MCACVRVCISCSVQIPIVRCHITQPLLFLFCWDGQGAVSQATLALLVIMPGGQEVEYAESGRETQEGQTDDITGTVEGRVLL